MQPLVALLWVNYNSMPIIDVVLDSLRSIEELDYDNYVLIAVDNASTDGSWEKLLERIEAARRKGLRVITVQLAVNSGFTGGMNAAYRLALKLGARYVAVLNNDAAPFNKSIEMLVEFMEQHPCVGSVQGAVLYYGEDRVQTAGNYLSELLTAHLAFEGLRPGELPRKPYHITYASGAYALYRVKAVKEARRDQRLFDDWVFAYFDDNAIGLALWGAGYRVVGVPRPAGWHVMSATFKRQGPRRLYLTSRGHLLAAHVSASKYRAVVEASYLRRLAYYASLEAAGAVALGSAAAIARAIRDARKQAHRVAARHTIRKGYATAPILHVKSMEATMYMLSGTPLTRLLYRRAAALAARHVFDGCDK